MKKQLTPEQRKAVMEGLEKRQQRAQADGTAPRMSQLIAMSYLTAAIANAYLEEGVDIMKKLGVFRHEVKQKMNLSIDFFDKFNASIKWIFGEKVEKDVGDQICQDYEILKDACDRYMQSGIRASARRAWNNDSIRINGLYLVYTVGSIVPTVLRWNNGCWTQYDRETRRWKSCKEKVQAVIDKITTKDHFEK